MHFLRNVLAAAPKGSAEMVAAAIRTIFAEPKADMVRDQLGVLERLNKEVKRRTDVVGVFPDPEALLRWPVPCFVEAHDEWQTSGRRYLAEDSMALLTTPANEDTVASTELLTA